MIPIQSTIKGFGPYKDEIIVDWAELNSPVAVVATFGTGKTWLIEAVVAALYGSFAWYGGSIYDALTQGGDGLGEISLLFEHNFEAYMIERKVKLTGKTTKQSATLYREGLAIAGPKVRDCDRAVESLIGARETFLATTFFSQNRVADLVGMPNEPELVSRRRKVFNELIGATRLDQFNTKISDEQKRLKAIADELEIQLNSDTDIHAKLDQARADLSNNELNLKSTQRVHDDLSKRLENAKSRLRDAQSGDDQLNAQIDIYQNAVERFSDLEAKQSAENSKIEKLQHYADLLPEIEKDVVRFSELQKEKERLEASRKLFAEWNTWNDERINLENKLSSAKAKIEGALSDFNESSDDDEKLAAQLESLREQYQKASSENQEIEKRNLERNSQERDISFKIEVSKSAVREIENRLDAKPETPFGDKCSPCPFMQEFTDLPNQLEIQRQIQDELNEKLALIPKEEPLIDLVELARKGSEARSAADRVQSLNLKAESIREMQIAFNNDADILKKHEQQEPQRIDDPAEKIGEIDQQLLSLNSPEQRKETASIAIDTVEKSRAVLQELKPKLEQVEKSVNDSKEKAESARAALKDREQQRIDLKKAVEQLEFECKSSSEKILALTGKRAQLRAFIEVDTERIKANEEKRDRVKHIRDDLEGLADLRVCFGPKGVKQILIDAAAPELEAIADKLFEQATAGRQRLRIATQAANREGELLETFDILVKDKNGERDATRYSGGQLQMIQILFRIAVAIWVGKIRGVKPECLFLDEAFDRLGADGTDDLLRVLESLGDQIGLIVLITHDHQIAARMRSRIELSETAGGVRIRVV